jgi:hypothetical protein
MGNNRPMRYIIAGKRESLNKYLKDHPLNNGEQIKYCRGPIDLIGIKKEDKVVLLPGWFAKEWAEQTIKNINEMYPYANFEYHDGKVGESERKSLKSEKSETIYSRFDILDL